MATSKKGSSSDKKAAGATAAKTGTSKTGAAKKVVPAKKATALKKVEAKAEVKLKKPVASAASAAAVTSAVEAVAVKAAATPLESDVAVSGAPNNVRRRDFINIAAVAWVGVGAGVVVLPLVGQMGASADVRAQSSIEVDISAIEPGQAIKTQWRKQPVFIRNLTTTEVEAAKKDDGADMREPQTLAQRTKPGKENWLVTLGVCTHLGCVPTGAATGEIKGDFNGYFCPCHGSHYDIAGRIRKGPAPLNLVVPEYAFASDTLIKIG